jgi:hypothetical protein
MTGREEHRLAENASILLHVAEARDEKIDTKEDV